MRYGLGADSKRTKVLNGGDDWFHGAPLCFTRRFGEERRNETGKPERVTSIFLRQQQSGYRAVCFGNGPQLFSLRDWIAAQQAETILQA